MKAFLAIVLILAAMLCCIVFNYFYINKTANELTAMTYDIPPLGDEGCYTALSRLDEYWKANHDRVGLSVSFVELNRVTDAITSMKSYALTGTRTGDSSDYVSDFECARELLLNAISEMRRLEAFTIGNIL